MKMKKKILALALVLSAAFAGSCASGPHQLARTVDDWDAKTYTNSPWMNAALHIIPVIPLAQFGAQIGDFFVTDAYYFWFKDAWDGKGTGFKHAEFLGEDGHLESLLLDGSKFLRISDGGK